MFEALDGHVFLEGGDALVKLRYPVGVFVLNVLFDEVLTLEALLAKTALVDLVTLDLYYVLFEERFSFLVDVLLNDVVHNCRALL